MERANHQREKPGRHMAWAIALLILLTLVVAAGTFFIWYGIRVSREASAASSSPLDENVRVGTLVNDAEARKKELQKIVDEGMVSFKINATPYFENSRSPGTLMIENPKENQNRFTVKIVRKDNGQTIYQSGTISPGQYLENAPLSAKLPKGKYPCTAYFTTYRLTDGSQLGQAGAEITVYVDDKN